MCVYHTLLCELEFVSGFKFVLIASLCAREARRQSTPLHPAALLLPQQSAFGQLASLCTALDSSDCGMVECATTVAPVLQNASAALEERQAVGAAAATAANGYQKPPPKVMICNRGEIARRVIRTANQHGLETVAIYTHVSTATDRLSGRPGPGARLSCCCWRESQ